MAMASIGMKYGRAAEKAAAWRKSAIGETESLKAKSSGVAAKSMALANGENGGGEK
jgi:hypothetical protein